MWCPPHYLEYLYMATRAVFTPPSAEFYDTTNFPALTTVNGRMVLAFDATTDENICWTSVVPQGLTGTITVVISYFMASATTGAVRWQCQLECVTASDALDLDAATSFDTANTAGGTVGGVAGYMTQTTVTMSNTDAMTAGDVYRLRVSRDADGTSGTDDATGDAYLWTVELRDAA